MDTTIVHTMMTKIHKSAVSIAASNVKLHMYNSAYLNIALFKKIWNANKNA